MPNLKDLKKRIRSVKTTSKTTKAMKLVSASKLRKSKDQIDQHSPFFEELYQIVQRLFHHLPEDYQSSYLQTDETAQDQKELLIILGADKGLCGSYNGGVVKKYTQFIKSHPQPEKLELLVIGKKINDVLKYRKIKVDHAHTSFWKQKISFDVVQEFIEQNVSLPIHQKKYSKIHIIFTIFKSALSVKPVDFQIYPLASHELEKISTFIKNAIPVDTQGEMDTLPGIAGFADKTFELFILSFFYFALLNSQASEHGSRMAAMDNATRNAKEMIDMLTLKYNRLRQEAITKDLIDIIGGAQAV